MGDIPWSRPIAVNRMYRILSIWEGTNQDAKLSLGQTWEGNSLFFLYIGLLSQTQRRKSSSVRMTALIVLMAQVGSYVPATSVKMGLVDSILTRMGGQLHNLYRALFTYFSKLRMILPEDDLRSWSKCQKRVKYYELRQAEAS